MLERFKDYIADKQLIGPGDKILLAVSGGIDSMVMTHLFRQLSYKIGIAHCNFSLRGIESDQDEAMVRKCATDNNIKFHSVRFETREYAANKGLSIQMAARELRYTWFEEIRKKNGYDSISVAHNLNDNIETMIINLIRGTGIAGLTGMKPITNNIIRPLLFATRNQIVEYSNLNDVPYREDRSNTETKYIRNKIRHLVIPVLKDINPSVESTLSEMLNRFSGTNEILEEYISDLTEKISVRKDDLISFNVIGLRALSKNKTILYELFKPFSINNLQVDELIKIINGRTGGNIITGTHRIIKNRNEIIVSPDISKNKKFIVINDLEELHAAGHIDSAIIMPVTVDFTIPSDSATACLDAGKITFPLTIRSWNNGDYFYPFGMQQKKKLSNYFVDNKYSAIKKEKALILESDGNIVWLIGDRIDNRFRISRSTSNALIIKFSK